MEADAFDLFKKAVDDDSDKKLLHNRLKKIVKICGGVQKIHANFSFPKHIN